MEFVSDTNNIDKILNNRDFEEMMARRIIESSAWKEHERSKGEHHLMVRHKEEGEEDMTKHLVDTNKGFNYDKKEDSIYTGCTCGMRFSVSRKDNSVYVKDSGIETRKEKTINENSEYRTIVEPSNSQSSYSKKSQYTNNGYH